MKDLNTIAFDTRTKDNETFRTSHNLTGSYGRASENTKQDLPS